MIGILYFSSTGNSLYIAKAIQKELSGSLCYIPGYEGDGSEFSRLILVSPIYSFGLPEPVYDLIPRLAKGVKTDMVLSYGGMCAGADRFAYDHAKDCGVDIRSVYTVMMPENFTLVFTVPKFYMKQTLKKAPRKIAAVIEKLRSETPRVPRGKAFLKDTHMKNKGNWHKLAHDFHTGQDCTLCGLCADLCPVGNISLENGKVEFADKCIACLGCYHRCPNKAILYKDKVKEDRYFHPQILPQEIGMDG